MLFLQVKYLDMACKTNYINFFIFDVKNAPHKTVNSVR